MILTVWELQALSQRSATETILSRGHSPTLTTQIMVERCIRDNASFPSRCALMRELPHKIEYRTLVRILQYLEASQKIVFAEDGSIVWVFTDNPKLLKLLEESPVLSKGTPTSQSLKELRNSTSSQDKYLVKLIDDAIDLLSQGRTLGDPVSRDRWPKQNSDLINYAVDVYCETKNNREIVRGRPESMFSCFHHKYPH